MRINVVIPAGITSDLILNFIKTKVGRSQNYNIWAYIREESKKKEIYSELNNLGVRFVTKEKILELPYKVGAIRAIWASTHSELEWIEKIGSVYPNILLIGTAAMVNKKGEPQIGQFYGDEKWNMWQKCKDQSCLIMPGWIIPDINKSNGLNAKNADILFRDKSFKEWGQTLLNKTGYSVTPMSKLIGWMDDWILSPYNLKRPLLASTVEVYSWNRLRNFSEGKMEGDLKPIYCDLPRAFDINKEEVFKACIRARKLYN